MKYGPAMVLVPVLALSLSCAARQESATGSGAPAEPSITGYFCPMHPDVTSRTAGATCGKCGMRLIAGNPFDTRDYGLDFATQPPAVRAGVPFTMTFRVRHPDGQVLRRFETVHDRQYHLFVISQDMQSFQHVHPELQADGSWTLDVTVPAPGYYRVLSDFLPTGGSPQFLGRSLVTSDYEGDLASQEAQLADEGLKRTADSIAVEIKMDPLATGLSFRTDRLIAGRWGHMSYHLTDRKTGAPVTDLQPYLGSFGHTLIMSEDLRDYVHSHPTSDDGTSKEALDPKERGGPQVNFEGYMPRAGRYRAWTQFMRHGKVETVAFTFTVATFEEVVPPAR